MGGPDDPVDVSPLMVLALNQVFPLNVPNLIERLTNGTNPLEVKDVFENTCSVDVKWKLQPELAVVSSDIEAFVYLDTLSTPPKITFESRSDISLKGVNKDETTTDWTHLNVFGDCEPMCGAHAENSFPEGTWHSDGIGSKKCLCISRVTGVKDHKYKMGQNAGSWVSWPNDDCDQVEVDGALDVFPGIRDMVKAQWDKLSKQIPNPWVISLDGGATREV